MLHTPIGTGAALAALIFAMPFGNDNANWVGPFGGLWNVPGNWSPRMVPLNNGITYFVTVSPPGAGQAIFNVSGSVDLLTIGPDDEVVVANGASLGIAQGSLTGNGTLTMNSVGNQTDLSFALGQSLIDGTIDVVASNTQANRFYSSSGGRVVVGTSASVRGAMQFGLNQTLLSNDGLLQAEGSSGIFLDLANGPNENTGLLRSAPGSFLTLNGFTLDSTDGTIAAGPGATVNLQSVTVLGGTLLDEDGAAGDGIVRNQSAVTLEDVSLQGDYLGPNGTSTFLVGSIQNPDRIRIESVGNQTDLRFDTSPFVLGGGGEIVTTNTQANRIYGIGGATKLVVPSDHEIRGAMQFGVNQMLLDNDGLIQAEGSAGVFMDLSAGTNTNTGLIRTAPESFLTLNGLALTNDRGVVAAGPGATLNLQSVTLIGGTLLDEDGSAGPGTVRNQSSTTLQDVALSGDYLNPNGTSTFLVGSVQNPDRIRLESVGNQTDLRIDTSPFSLDGGGEVVCTNTQANRIYGVTGDTRLVVPFDHEIHGAMQLGVNQLLLSNEGLIQAEGSAGIFLDLSGGENLNVGLIRAAPDSFLTLNGFTLLNFGGVLAAGPDSTVNLQSFTLIGGTLRAEDTGDAPGVVRNQSATTLEDVTLDGDYLNPNGTTTFLLGTIQNPDHILMQSVGNQTDLRFDSSPITLEGGGEIVCSNTQANRIYGVSGATRLIVPSDHTIRGSMQLGVNQMLLTNEGLIQAEGSAGVFLDLASGDNTNAGVIRADEGSSLTINGTTIANDGGTVAAGPGTSVFLQTSTIVGGNLTDEDGVAGPGVVRNQSSTTLEDVTIDGDYLNPNGATTFLVGGLQTNGRFRVESVGNQTDVRIETSPFVLSGSEMAFSNTLANRLYGVNGSVQLVNGAGHVLHGSFQLGVNQTQILNQGTIVADASAGINIDPTSTGIGFANEGTLSVTGGNLSILAGPFLNAGTVTIDADRTLTRTGDYSQDDGLTTVHGTLATTSGGAVQVEGGTVNGTGTVAGPLNNIGGTVSPGDLTGTLAATNGYTQSAGGTFDIQIGGLDAADYDSLAVTGTATLAGTLVVSRVNGFAPSKNDVFTILSAGTRVGEFDAIVSCDVVEVLYTDTTVEIRILNAGSIPGDLDGNGVVNGADLGLLLGLWGPCLDACCPADLTGDGVVDGGDLGILLGNWG